MKIKKQIEKIKGVELVEKADKGVLIVYLKQQISNNDLFELAKGMYPVGTKFIDLENGAIRTVSGAEHLVSDHQVNCGATPASEWITNDDWSNPFLYLDGQWAEIVYPLFTTEDGVEIFKGNVYWLVFKSNEVGENTACFGMDLSDSVIRFSTKESAQAYIQKQQQPKATNQSKTLWQAQCDGDFLLSSKASAQAWIDSQKPIVFVDGEIYTSKDDYGQWTFRFKSTRHKNYRGDITADAYSCLSDKDAYDQNDWLVVSGEDRTVAIASLEEKKRLIVAEVHNSYFHAL